MDVRRIVFNLQFPSWCNSITVGEYTFRRAKDYGRRIQELHQPVSVTSEFSIRANSGTHAVTAVVEGPAGVPAVLQWGHERPTALDDVELLITLFGSRNVFSAEEDEITEDTVITADPRTHVWGGTLRLAIPYKASGDDEHQYDVGFEQGLNRVLATIRSDAWQSRYERGHYLFLVRQLLRLYDLEPSFTQSWTLWEHFFTLGNRPWMSDRSIRKLPASEKVAFLMREHMLGRDLDAYAHSRIAQLVEIRNRLVHFGKLPDRGDVHDDAMMFVRLTEYLVARTLELNPRDEFGALADLEKYVSRPSPAPG